jgi:hypothetical protein
MSGTGNSDRVSRRTVLGTVVGAATGVAVGGTAAHGFDPVPCTEPEPVPEVVPEPVPEVVPLVESVKASMVAVRVFPNYAPKVYGQHAAVLERLGALGVKRMSHKLTPGIATDQAVIKFTQDAFNLYGIKTWFTVGESRVSLAAADWDKIVACLTGPLAGMVERCYGWNEPNHGRGGGPLTSAWPQQTGAHQSELWARVKPLGIAVGTPQMWAGGGSFAVHDADLRKLAPLIMGKFDHIGWHLYPRSGGAENVRNIERFKAIYFSLFGVHQVICTEAGHMDAPGLRLGGRPYNCTPAEKATKVPQLVDEYLRRGWGISYFELLDDPDPAGTNREANLGLVEVGSTNPATWVNKPSFDSLRTYLTT